MVSSKNAFWQALIFSAFIFGLGIMLGFFIEGLRSDKVESNIMNSEIDVLDGQLNSKILENTVIDCDASITNTFDFADKIYSEAVKMEKYDAVSKFKSILKTVHKRYDLLRMMVWQDAQSIKKKCPNNKLHTVIYIFEYDSQDVDLRAKQTAFSRVLMDLKSSNPSEILLIPVASNLDLYSVELIKQIYNVPQVPAIIIDEKIVITNIPNLEEIQSIIRDKNASNILRI